MNPRPGFPKNIYDRCDRACARLASIATWDTIFGGAQAMVIARRMSNWLKTGVPAEEIVSDVYSRSSGRTSERWGAWECDECGQTHLGREAAAECCTHVEELEEETA